MKRNCHSCGTEVELPGNIPAKTRNNPQIIECPKCKSVALLKFKKNGGVKGLKCAFMERKFLRDFQR